MKKVLFILVAVAALCCSCSSNKCKCKATTLGISVTTEIELTDGQKCSDFNVSADEYETSVKCTPTM